MRGLPDLYPACTYWAYRAIIIEEKWHQSIIDNPISKNKTQLAKYDFKSWDKSLKIRLLLCLGESNHRMRALVNPRRW